LNRDSRHSFPIIFALVVAIAPHAPGLPAWIIVWCVFMWGYMLVRLKTGWPLPGPILRHILAAAGITGLLLFFSVRIDADAFVGLMAVMAAIKPFEMATHRHRMITVLLTYFIIITSLFRSESLWIVLYLFFSVFVTTAALIHINRPEGRYRPSILLAVRILAQAIPLMVLLFLVFPRLQHGLFSMETPGTGRSGFSERLGFGSISRMTLDQSLAFRVTFNGALPPPDALYWRGIVFDRFDGTRWLPADNPGDIPFVPENGPDLVQHTITLEPHKSRRLFALDRPVAAPPGTELTAGFTLVSRQRVTRKKTYQAVSCIRTAGNDNGKTGTLLPDPVFTHSDNNPKARFLARAMAEKTADAHGKIQQILAYFTENDFTYTLSPQRLGNHPMDEFLFETRQGYCEHYAGALAFLLNVQEVPARVVGGYLGGELNPYGNYLSIRQSFAHAWVEAYTPERGWIRIDPTLAVAPNRLEQNPDGSFSYSSTTRDALSFFKKMGFMLEAVNLAWEAWFTGYSFSEQKALLQRLGFGRSWGTGTVGFLLLTLSVLVVAVFFWMFLHRSCARKKDPVAAGYALFCRRLASIGLDRTPDQGPMDYLLTVQAKRPDLGPEAAAITDMYIRIRFHKTCPDNLTKRFIDQVKQFTPARRAGQ
jgi:transglutaminase-like putative cysteine protease